MLRALSIIFSNRMSICGQIREYVTVLGRRAGAFDCRLSIDSFCPEHPLLDFVKNFTGLCEKFLEYSRWGVDRGSRDSINGSPSDSLRHLRRVFQGSRSPEREGSVSSGLGRENGP